MTVVRALRRFGGARVLLLVCSLVGCSSASTAPRPKVALFIGDSIMYEVRAPVRDEMAARGWTATVSGRPGIALCDLTDEFRARILHDRPALVVVETQGDLLSRCMATNQAGVPVPLGSGAYFRRYRAAMDLFVSVAHEHHARIVFVAPLPVPQPTTNAAFLKLRDLERKVVARHPPATMTDAPRDAVTLAGAFTDTLPCSPGEQDRPACSGGRIRVREALQGLHLCPTPYFTAQQTVRECPTYSSGAVRYGRALVDAVVRARRAPE